MAETDSLPPAPETTETPQPRQNTNREELGQWGEPINFTIPAPFADMVRNIVNTHANGNGFRHRSMRRMGRGFGGRGGRRGGPSRGQSPRRNDANNEEVSEEVKALREALQEVKEEEKREAEAVHPIVEPAAPSEAAWAAIPAMIKQKIEEGKRKNERVPSWVEAMLKDFEEKAQKEKEAEKAKEVIIEETPLVQATPVEKDAFETEEEGETAPWLQNGDRKKFAEERMKRFSKDKKCGKKGNKGGKQQAFEPHGHGGPGPHGFGARGRPGFGPGHRGMGPPRGRSSERKIVGNIGPFEMELTLTQTEKIVPNNKGTMKGKKEGKCKDNKLTKEQKMMNKEARLSAKKTEKEARLSAKLANKEAKKEEKEIKQAVKKAEKAAKKEEKDMEVKAEPFYPEAQPTKEKEVATPVEPESEQGALTQAELFQLFEVLKKEFKKQ